MNSAKTIPKEWQVKKVKDVCEIGRGRVISKNEIRGNVGNFPVYSSQSFNNGEMGRLKTFDFDGEYVTWTTDGAYAGTVFYRNEKFNCTNVCGTLKAKADNLNMKFLSLALNCIAEKYVVKTGNPKLMNNIMAEIPVLLPTAKEQNKIAEILSSVDEEIEKVDQEIKKTEELKRGLMQELLTGKVRVLLSFRTERSGERNPLNVANGKGVNNSRLRDSSLSLGMTKKTKLGVIPEEWGVVKIKDSGIKLIDGDRGINYPKLKDFSNDGYCVFLSNKNIKNDRFVFDECSFVTKEKDEKLRKGKLKREDIVLTSRGTVGNVAYYNSQVPFDNIRINSGMLIFRHGKNYDPLFLYKLLSGPFMKKMYKNMGSGSAQPQLPIKSLEQIEIPLLPKEEQKQIAGILSAIDDKIDIKKLIKNKLIQLKKGLMQDLLSGRVRV